MHLPLIKPPQALPEQLARSGHSRGTQRVPTYCCFLPDLTGFVGLCCAGPECQHHLFRADPAVAKPREGIQSRYSGLRVQGTANSPPSTANLIILLVHSNGAKYSITRFILFSNRSRYTKKCKWRRREDLNPCDGKRPN